MKLRILLVGNTHIDYGAESLIVKALKKAKHDVFELVYPTFCSSYSLVNGVLEAQMEGFKPDLVLCGKVMGLKYDDIIRLKETYKIPMVQWIFDKMKGVADKDVYNNMSRWDWWGKQAKAWDITFNAEDDLTDYYNSMGINHRILREGADIEIFKPIIPTNEKIEKYGCDVEFHATLYNNWRKNIVETFSNLKGVRFRHYKNTRLEELNTALNCAKICIASYLVDVGGSGWSARLVEAMASGILVISPFIKHMTEEGFIDKENIVYYNPRDIEDLKAKVIYYLKQEEERKEIAKKGMELIREKHTWDLRIKKFFEILTKEGIING